MTLGGPGSKRCFAPGAVVRQQWQSQATTQPVTPAVLAGAFMTAAPTETSVVDNVGKDLFIGGQWRKATDGKTLPVYDPSTGKVLCEVADASPEDGKAALDAAVAAQPSFAKQDRKSTRLNSSHVKI